MAQGNERYRAVSGAGAANVNARDEYGQTPLMTCYDTTYAKALITVGADVFARDNQGKTVLQAVQEFQDQNLIAVIESVIATDNVHVKAK